MGLEEFRSIVKGTRVFLYNMVTAVNFFIFGGFLTGYWLIVASIAVAWWVWVIAATAVMIITPLLGMMIEVAVAKPTAVNVKKPSHMEARWVASFILPVIILVLLYLNIDALGLTSYCAVLWYPFTGISMIIASILIERPKARLNPMLVKAKPFLMSGIVMLVTIPLPIAATLYMDPESGWQMALGILAITFTFSGLYTLTRSLKAFEEQ